MLTIKINTWYINFTLEQIKSILKFECTWIKVNISFNHPEEHGDLHIHTAFNSHTVTGKQTINLLRHGERHQRTFWNNKTEKCTLHWIGIYHQLYCFLTIFTAWYFLPAVLLKILAISNGKFTSNWQWLGWSIE